MASPVFLSNIVSFFRVAERSIYRLEDTDMLDPYCCIPSLRWMFAPLVSSGRWFCLLFVIACFQITVMQAQVHVSFDPPVASVNVGEKVTLRVEVATGTQLVDLVEVHIDFDAAILEVASLNPIANPLPHIGLVETSFDNSVGTIDYSAGTISDYPNGTFEILAIEFEAKASGSAAVDFSFDFPRRTISTYNGGNILSETSLAIINAGACANLVNVMPGNANVSSFAASSQISTMPGVQVVNHTVYSAPTVLLNGVFTVSQGGVLEINQIGCSE